MSAERATNVACMLPPFSFSASSKLEKILVPPMLRYPPRHIVDPICSPLTPTCRLQGRAADPLTPHPHRKIEHFTIASPLSFLSVSAFLALLMLLGGRIFENKATFIKSKIRSYRANVLSSNISFRQPNTYNLVAVSACL